MKLNLKQFRKKFLITVSILALLGLSLNLQNARTYYSQFTSPEKIQSYFDNNEVIPNGTMMLGTGGETVVFLTTTGAGTWTVPAGVSSAIIECIGGGGTGNNGTGGGGGGAYSKKNSLALTSGASISYSVGAGGGEWSPGGDTWFKSTSDVLAKGGAMAYGNPAKYGGGGGQASGGVGDVKYSGGNGGLGTNNYNGGGGGGAGGGNGNGNNGTNATDYLGGNGGSGDNSSGGGAGIGAEYINYPSSRPATAGGNGTEWDATHGSGGGGGGGYGQNSPNAFKGANGGNYGAGGGGAGYGAGGGLGIQGLIVITYEPAASGNSNFFMFFN